MATKEKKVTQILCEAETRLLKQIAAFANDGDLDGIDLARSAAGRLRSIIESLSSPQQSRGEQPAPSAKAKKKSSAVQISKAGYPTFCVEAEQLQKTGWSKKSKKEYHQKVPRKNYEAVVRCLAELAATGTGPHTGEQITARVEERSNPTVPSYQTYVVLGALKQAGGIDQVGREGYMLSHDLETRTREIWERMQARQKTKL